MLDLVSFETVIALAMAAVSQLPFVLDVVEVWKRFRKVEDRKMRPVSDDDRTRRW